MEKIVNDKEMQFALKFKWIGENPYWIDIEGVEIGSYVECEEDTPEYEMGSGSNENKTFEEAYKANKLLDGYIKCDGCMEIHEFSHHWCYHNTFAQRIVDMIYEQASIIMKGNFNP
jgi:hypothetical protein